MSPLSTSDRVLHWETHRGRNNEFNKTEAGSAVIVLQNRDGLFDPFSLDSEYQLSGNLEPMRQVTITANSPEFPTVYKPVFTGYVDSWDYERRGPRHAVATVQCVDGFEVLQQAQVKITKKAGQAGHWFPEQDVQYRIWGALEMAGWPAERTSIFTGNVSVKDGNYPPGSSMLQVIQDAADAEFPGVANFYMDARGVACFRGREYRLDPFNGAWDQPVTPPDGDWTYGTPAVGVHGGAGSRSASLWRFGDQKAIEEDPTLLPLANLTWTYGRDHLYNHVTIIPAEWPDADQYLLTNSDSVVAQRYGRRDLTITGIIIEEGTSSTPVQTAGQECRRFARYYLDNYKVPHVRANMLEVHSKFEDDRIWQFLLNVDIGDVVELYTINPGGYGFGGEQFFVDGIHNVVDAQGDWPQWVSQYDLSPLQYYLSFPPPFAVGA
jgi:hypothetical protein